MTDPNTTDGSLRVTTDHPGGNGHVLEIERTGDATTVRLEPETRDSTVRWFAWNVRLRCDDARDVLVEFPNDEVIGRWGPAVRTDRPVSSTDSQSGSRSSPAWRWLGRDRRLDASRFTYSFEAGERAQFAFSFPYQLSDLESFVSAHEIRLETLTKTAAGRSVPLVRLGSDASDRHLVVACRHHACESTASYVLEGFVRALCRRDVGLLDDTEYRLHVFPMVDLDGVERGDPGKHRVPHDHNRDYTMSNAIAEFEQCYPSTAAITEYVRDLEGDVAFGLDLHCPYKWGDQNDRPFVAADPETAPDGIGDLATALEEQTRRRDGRQRRTGDGQRSTLAFDASPDVGMTTFDGIAGPVPAFVPFLWSEGADLAATLEIPYVGTEENPVTPATARGLGADLARALEACLE